MTIKRYDMLTDSMVEVTQKDWDELQERLSILGKFAITPPEQRRRDHNGFYKTEEFECRLKVYPNPMNPHWQFVAQDLPIKPYEDVFGLDGKPIYPAVPREGLKLPYGFAPNMAEEIVKRWNAYEAANGR